MTNSFCVILPDSNWTTLQADNFADAEKEAATLIANMSNTYNAYQPGRRYFIVPTGSFGVYTVPASSESELAQQGR